ncbi:MAG: nucleotidyl transferase AbiEii/AbiGii toxin family protein [Candidatus Dormibacteria bacterium]
MKYATAAAFRAALERRLQNRSKQTGMSLVRLRKAVVFDRLLARLVAVAPGRWVLKGALALDYRLGMRTRTTKDVDVGRSDDEEAATADLLSAQAADLGDFFVFVVQRTDRLNQLREGAAVRYHVDCQLAGRLFDAIIVDVAFGDPIVDAPDMLRGPDLLVFAGMEPVEVPAIRLSQHIAEKVHAYARAYGAGGVQSTRVKDLVDLVLIAEAAELDAGELRAALGRAFGGRGAQPLPAELPRPPEAWRVPYRRMAGEVGLTTDLGAAHVVAAALLNPVLGGRVRSGRWDPSTRSWR